MKKLLSFTLAFLMVISLFPVSASASGVTQTPSYATSLVGYSGAYIVGGCGAYVVKSGGELWGYHYPYDSNNNAEKLLIQNIVAISDLRDGSCMALGGDGTLYSVEACPSEHDLNGKHTGLYNGTANYRVAVLDTGVKRIEGSVYLKENGELMTASYTNAFVRTEDGFGLLTESRYFDKALLASNAVEFAVSDDSGIDFGNGGLTLTTNLNKLDSYVYLTGNGDLYGDASGYIDSGVSRVWGYYGKNCFFYEKADGLYALGDDSFGQCGVHPGDTGYCLMRCGTDDFAKVRATISSPRKVLDSVRDMWFTEEHIYAQDRLGQVMTWGTAPDWSTVPIVFARDVPGGVTNTAYSWFTNCDPVWAVISYQNISWQDESYFTVKQASGFDPNAFHTVNYIGARADGTLYVTGEEQNLPVRLGEVLTTTVSLDPNAFSDVKPGDYYYDPIKWAAGSKIANGTGGGRFSPMEYCTRAQIITFLYRALSSPAVSGGMPVSDTPDGEFYSDAVKWAYQNGICSDALFRPQEPCTRAMAVEFIWRALGSEQPSAPASFPDVPPTAPYVTAVAWALEHNVTNGTGNGFSPDETCTRGQIVTFLYRAFAG